MTFIFDTPTPFGTTILQIKSKILNKIEKNILFGSMFFKKLLFEIVEKSAFFNGVCLKKGTILKVKLQF